MELEEERVLRIYRDDEDRWEPKRRREWTRDNVIHNLDGPAIVTTAIKTGTVLSEEWYFEGKRGRISPGPSSTYHLGEYVRTEWHSADRLHNDFGPAYVVTNAATGVLVTEEYWHFGKRHRPGKPAVIERSDSGQLIREEYFNHGVLSRHDGPAVIIYDPESGKVVSQQHLIDGKRTPTATDGPSAPSVG